MRIDPIPHPLSDTAPSLERRLALSALPYLLKD
jgi:hypothetical protein